MKTYRVFLARDYRAVIYFDVQAPTAAQARTKAKRAAYKVEPDPRMTATDNGWLPDHDGTEIPGVGSDYAHPRGNRRGMIEVARGVFQDRFAYRKSRESNR